MPSKHPRAAPILPPDGLAAGAVLSETYRIISRLAEGGFGEVYLAAHTRLPGRFAVKLLHRSLARDSEALARFRQEAEITSTLRHPHIVQVFDFNVTDAGLPYLVMELLEGQPLSRLVAAGLPVSPRRAAVIVEQIAQALHTAHESGVVHRDLKPDNVMLLGTTGAEDFVKVLDFGISKASWRTRLTQNDTVSGTPQYMSPEQARGQRDQIDHRADQFSLAAIAYALLTGREAFSGDEPVAVLYRVVHEDPPRPAAVNPKLDEVIDAVVMRGLAKDPAARYPDVLDFARALREAVSARFAGSPAAVSDDAPVVGGAAAVLSLGSDDPVPELGPEEVPAPGRETRRLIRRVQRRLHRPRRLVALALAVGLATAVWFHPATRGVARADWHQVEQKVHTLFDHFAQRG